MYKCGGERMSHLPFKVGEKWRFKHEGLLHIIAIIEVDDVELVVYKSWGRRKQRWYYSCEDTRLFSIWFKYGEVKVK